MYVSDWGVALWHSPRLQYALAHYAVQVHISKTIDEECIG